MNEGVEPNIYNVPELKQEGEPWLDLEKEKAYEDLLSGIDSIEMAGGKKAIQEAFIKVFNAYDLKTEEIGSLEYVKVESVSASEVAGKKIIRPIFIFFDISEFQELSKKIRGDAGMSSRGMVIAGSNFPEDSLLHKTGLIIATSGINFISHEIRHTIDPNLEKRVGEDIILNELFGYYQKTIIEADLKKYAHIKNPEDGPWNTLTQEVGQDIYYNKAKKNTKLSFEQYKDKAKEAVNALRLVVQKRGHIEAQRAILQSKTLEELMELSKI